jgi:hypothetical protein
MAFSVTAQLFAPPIVGLADNADFGKVIGPFGLAGFEANERRFVQLRYEFGSDRAWLDSPFRSAERALVWIAVGLNRLVSRDGTFDIRVMGAVHAALYLGVWWLLLPRLGWAAILAALVFADVMYVSLLNSFHMDVAALLGLVAMVAFDGHLAGGLAVVLSKTQHAPLGPVLAVGALLRRSRWRWVGAAAPLAGAVWMFAGSPPEYARIATYNVVFFRLLPGSRDVGADLAELGLDNSVRRYIGTYAYQPESGLDDPATEVSHARIAAYYLRHPVTAWEHMTAAMQEAARLRHLVGNFTRESGKPEYAESATFAWWSDAKRAMFEPSGVRFTVASLLLIAVSIAWAVRTRSLMPGLLAAMALLKMGIGTLADTLEVARHLFLFHAMCDLMLILLVGGLANRCDHAGVIMEE